MKNRLFLLILAASCLIGFGINGALPQKESPEEELASKIQTLSPELKVHLLSFVLGEPDFVKAVQSAEPLTEKGDELRQLVFSALVSRFKSADEAQEELSKLIRQDKLSFFALAILKTAGASLDKEGSLAVLDEKSLSTPITPLGWSAAKGRSGIVQILISHGANVNKASKGKSPLQYALTEDVVKILINAGADLGINDIGKKLLANAVYKSDKELVNLLLEKGVKPDFITDVAVIENSPLGIAISEGNLNLVKLLLEKGANPNYAAGSFLPIELAQIKMEEEKNSNKKQAYELIIDLLKRYASYSKKE